MTYAAYQCDLRRMQPSVWETAKVSGTLVNTDGEREREREMKFSHQATKLPRKALLPSSVRKGNPVLIHRVEQLKFTHKMKIYSPSGHPAQWVFFFFRRDLEKFSITTLAHQWILCSEWVPSEWVQTADKNTTIINMTPVCQLSCEVKSICKKINKSIIKRFNFWPITSDF